MTEKLITVQYEGPDTYEINAIVEYVGPMDQPFYFESDADCADAVDAIEWSKKKLAALDAKRKTITRPLDEAKKAAIEVFAPAVDALTRHIAALKIGLAENRSRRIAAQEEQRKLLENAAEKARETLREASSALAKSGDAAGAAEKMIQACVVAAPAPAPVTVAGATFYDKWTAEVTDKLALVCYIADHHERADLLDLLDVNQTKLTKMAAAMEGSLKIPGVRPYTTPVTRVG